MVQPFRVRQAEEGLDSVQIFSQIKTNRGGGFREKIFFDFYFFVWLVQTLTKTFFNSNNGKIFLIVNYFLILFLPKNQIGKNKINPINANASRIIFYSPFQDDHAQGSHPIRFNELLQQHNNQLFSASQRQAHYQNSYIQA